MLASNIYTNEEQDDIDMVSKIALTIANKDSLLACPSRSQRNPVILGNPLRRQTPTREAHQGTSGPSATPRPHRYLLQQSAI